MGFIMTSEKLFPDSGTHHWLLGDTTVLNRGQKKKRSRWDMHEFFHDGVINLF